MQAIVYREYGDPRDVFHIEDVPTPVPGDGQILVRVRAAASNPLDCFVPGTPYVARIAMGIRRPKPTTPGVDVAGVVEAVGPNATRFRPGDEVFGSARGAFAEFVCGKESGFTRKPTTITFEQAAAIPVAGLTALQALRDKGRLAAGQRVLITGAGGGVGSFAVQIAKALGAHVTAVCGPSSAEVVRSIGADRVIDYTQADFTRERDAMDLLVDCAGRAPLGATRRVVKSLGNCVVVGMSQRPIMGPIPRLLRLLALRAVPGPRLVFFIAKVDVADLDLLAGMVVSGKVTPVIGRVVPLAEAGEAVAHILEGHARGKAVVTMR
ncbi:MAG: NAD(P)-dependent alcohol dehydrogenase [Gemmatimonadaceae bacterium]